MRYDEQKVDGVSGKSKTPQGWEDQTVTATLVLLTDAESDCYEKLAKLAPFFRQPDKKANPQIYTLANRHTQARGIQEAATTGYDNGFKDGWDNTRLTVEAIVNDWQEHYG